MMNFLVCLSSYVFFKPFEILCRLPIRLLLVCIHGVSLHSHFYYFSPARFYYTKV
jgi:hypothetical protein